MLIHDISAKMSFLPAQQDAVEGVLGQAYGLHLKILVGVAVAEVLAGLLIWKRPQLSIH